MTHLRKNDSSLMYWRNPFDGNGIRDVFKVEEENEVSYITMTNFLTVYRLHETVITVGDGKRHAFPKEDCFPVDIFDKELKEKYYAKLKEKK